MTREKFDAAFRDHRSKIERAEWAVLWAHGVFGELPEGAIRPAASKRMAALYVDIDNKLLPITPKQSISEQEAHEMIRIAEAGLEKIRCWEAMGVQIGTKGFMK
jgi:AbiV family abortive infection protein